ncbi:UNVERIFIED_CONTAM: hypothetical protein FKN15_058360 [Acipenser sinensis]
MPAQKKANISDAMKAQLGSEGNNIYTDDSSEHHQLRLVCEITDVSHLISFVPVCIFIPE